MKQHIFVLILSLIFFDCAAHSTSATKDPGVLRIKGSDSMSLLVQRFAEQFMKQHPDISVYTEGGGSGLGIQALIDGSIDICATSRPLIPEEVRQLAERHRSIGVSTLCAKDALGIVVHPSNPVNNLSMQEIKNIFTGKIVNWKDVGGYDMPITVYGRESNSGTYLFFEEHVLLGEEYSDECTVVPGVRALINSIALDSSAIGYSTFVYTEHVKLLSVDGVVQTIENVRNGTYPITRYLYFYTIHPPDGEMKKFIDWVISREGQNIVKINGYIPLYEVE